MFIMYVQLECHLLLLVRLKTQGNPIFCWRIIYVYLCEELALVSLAACSFGEVVAALTILEVVVVVFSCESFLRPVALLDTVVPRRLSILSLVLCSSKIS